MIKYEDLYKFTKKLSVLYAEYDKELGKDSNLLFNDLFKRTDNEMDGKGALEKYQNFYKNNEVYYDIVFTAIDLPIMNGHKLIDEINKINPEQVIIVISSHHDSNRFIKLIEQEIESYIAKPIDKDNLISVLYKVSQNIIDNKLTKKHVKGMNKFNKMLKQRVREEIQKNSQKEIRLMEQANALSKEQEIQKHKDMFLANMSHEIRTPLNGIIGFTNIIKNTELTKEQEKYINLISASSEILSSVINDILDFSKVAEGKLELDAQPTNCKIELQKLLDIFETKIKEKELDFIINIDPNLPECVMCDQNRIKQVITNLIGNAIKFTNKGSIEFSAILISQNSNTATVKFCIKDTGIGIAKNKQEVIFQAFTQESKSTSTKFGGTGLGISIAKRLVELAGGKLELESTPDVGTEFYFTIKVEICEKVLTLKQEDKNTNICEFDNSHILVAEDNLVNQELMTAILNSKNIEITIANNGQEVIEIYENDASKFDMILMDIHMPIVSGLKALSRIRNFEKINNIKNIPIVAITANTIKGDREKYMKLGMNDYLSKPIDMQKLNQVLINFLSLNRICNIKETNTETLENISDEFIYSVKNIAKELETNETIIEKLLKKFFKKFNSQIKDMQDLVKQKDFNKLHRVLHAIKGTSGNLRLNSILELTTTLEGHAKNSNIDFQWNKHLKLLEKHAKEYKIILEK